MNENLIAVISVNSFLGTECLDGCWIHFFKRDIPESAFFENDNFVRSEYFTQETRCYVPQHFDKQTAFSFVAVPGVCTRQDTMSEDGERPHFEWDSDLIDLYADYYAAESDMVEATARGAI